MLGDLLIYKNRQIILNEFVDDELKNRKGFYFEEMNLEFHSILFLKGGLVVDQFNWPSHATIRKDGCFPHFYILEWDLIRIEIYFP
jgi:hypothetical protein